MTSRAAQDEFASRAAATGRTFSPVVEAGLRPGDRILKAEGIPVLSSDELGRVIQECGQKGRALTLEVLRRGERLEFTVRPMPRRDSGSSKTSYVIGVMFGGVPELAQGIREGRDPVVEWLREGE